MPISRVNTGVCTIVERKCKGFSLRTAIGRHVLERLPVACLIEIEVPIVSSALFLEINQESKLQGLSPKTSIHSRAPGAIVPPIFPMNQRLCSSPGVAAFGREWTETSLFGCGISALAVPRRSAPASWGKPSRIGNFNLLPHENEN